MSYPNDRDPRDRDVYSDADGTVPRREPHHQDDYRNTALREEERLYDAQQSRDNDNASRGLLLGILLAALLGLPLLWYFLSQRNEPVQQSPTLIIPNTQSPAPSPQVQERIIERENNTITVPSNEAPAAPPDVNITVPTTAPVAPPDVNITVPTTAPEAPSNSAPTTAPNDSGTSAPDTSTSGTDSSSTTNP